MVVYVHRETYHVPGRVGGATLYLQMVDCILHFLFSFFPKTKMSVQRIRTTVMIMLPVRTPLDHSRARATKVTKDLALNAVSNSLICGWCMRLVPLWYGNKITPSHVHHFFRCIPCRIRLPLSCHLFSRSRV